MIKWFRTSRLSIKKSLSQVPASLLGFRINEKFVKQFFGRVLANPSTVVLHRHTS